MIYDYYIYYVFFSEIDFAISLFPERQVKIQGSKPKTHLHVSRFSDFRISRVPS